MELDGSGLLPAAVGSCDTSRKVVSVYEEDFKFAMRIMKNTSVASGTSIVIGPKAGLSPELRPNATCRVVQVIQAKIHITSAFSQPIN